MRLILPPLACLAVLACSGDSQGPSTFVPPPTVAGIAIVSGNLQEGRVGEELPEQVVVVVFDDRDRAVAGATVTFDVRLGGGSVVTEQTTTDASGRASTRWILGPSIDEPQNLLALTPNGSSSFAVVFVATPLVGDPATLEKTAGDLQFAGAGATLPDSLTVRVTDEFGNPIVGESVTWTPGAGSGTVSPTTLLTDMEGLASAEWTLGPGALSSQTVTASVPVVGDAVFGTGGPTITLLSPNSALIGADSLPLTVTGVGLPDGSVVQWNGTALQTTFVDDTQLTAVIPAENLVDLGIAQVTVLAPLPGGGLSDSLAFSIENPAPILAAVDPPSIPAGSTGITLSVSGSNFLSEAVVEWEGTALVTSFLADTLLSAPVGDAAVAVSGTFEVTVRNPSPGGGVSGGFNVAVTNPVPTLTSLTPTIADAASASLPIEVRGQGFVVGTRIMIDGDPRVATVVDDSTLALTLGASDLSTARDIGVGVFNPQPGGGSSNIMTLSLLNPVPSITTASLEADLTSMTGELVVMVSGTGFGSGAILRWDGSDRVTTVVDHTRLTAAILPTDELGADTVTVTVFNPGPGGGESAGAALAVDTRSAIFEFSQMPILAQDVLFDASRSRLYVSVDGADATFGNNVVVIDPATASVIKAIPVGSDPGVMAMSENGQFLYVGLNGSSSIRRVDLNADVATIEISLGVDQFGGPIFAGDIVGLRGTPTAIAVALLRSATEGGVIVFDDAIPRMNRISFAQANNDRIELAATSSKIYGFNNSTSEFGLRWLAIDAQGITETNTFRGLLFGFGDEIKVQGDRLYSSGGQVVDPEAGVLLGRFDGLGRGGITVEPDSANRRVYFIKARLEAYDLDSFSLIGSAAVPASGGFQFPRSLVRWGTDGLAYANGDGLIILRTLLVQR